MRSNHYATSLILAVYSTLIKLCLTTIDVTTLKNLRNFVHVLLHNKSKQEFLFVLIMQKYTWKLYNQDAIKLCLDEAWVFHYS